MPVFLIAIVSLLIGISVFPLCLKTSLSITIIVMLAVMIVSAIGIWLLFKLINKHPNYAQHTSLNIKWKLLIFVLFLCIYTGLLIFWFPGTSDNDAIDIFNMLWSDDPYCNTFRYHGLNDHHTFAYCLFYYIICTPIFFITQNQTLAIGAACFVQVLIASLCFTRIVCRLYQATSKKYILIVAFLFFAINPLVLEMTVTHWKDVMFGSAFAVVVCELFCFTLSKTHYIKNKTNLVVLSVSLLFLSLIRKNGIMISIPVLIYLFCVAKPLKKYSIINGVLILLISVGGVSIAKTCMGVQSAHFSETIGIPIQQVAKTAVDTDTPDEEFQNYLNNILNYETMKETYKDDTPDNIKFHQSFNDEYLDSHKLEFFKNYITLGLKHPLSYITAWALQTRSYWSFAAATMFPFVPGHDLLITEPSSSQIALANIFAKVLKAYNPIYNAGILFWLTIIVLLKLFTFKQKQVGTLLPILILFMTLFLSVPAHDFRYVYGIHLCLPVLFCLLLFVGNKDKSAK